MRSAYLVQDTGMPPEEMEGKNTSDAIKHTCIALRYFDIYIQKFDAMPNTDVGISHPCHVLSFMCTGIFVWTDARIGR